MKGRSNLQVRARRLELARGQAEDGEQALAVLLFAGTISRETALRQLWLMEVQQAGSGRAPDPKWPLGMMKLLDTVTYGELLKNGRDHRKRTGFAFDFSGWTRPEYELFAELQDRNVGSLVPSDEECERILALDDKISSLMTQAERVWAEDVEIVASLARGLDIGR